MHLFMYGLSEPSKPSKQPILGKAKHIKVTTTATCKAPMQ